MATRALTKTPRTRRSSKSWQDIDQSVKPKSRSSAAEKRVWSERLKHVIILIAIAGVVVAALQLRVFVEKGPELLSKAGESLPIAFIEIETDGFLEDAWVKRYLDIDPEDNLLSINLSSMKERLEQIGQVKSADVERVFPDGLRISIYERKPVVRLLAQEKNGDKLLLFVDAEGAVFKGSQIDRSIARSLPYVSGVELKRVGDSFSDIGGFSPIAKLLEEARTVAPHIYQTWRVINSGENRTVTIKNNRDAEMLFNLEVDFRAQLSRLDYIIDHYRGVMSKEVSFVDLTLGTQVPVRSIHASR